nr:hypothetical transcript [Hymenolepis microstoma]
MTKHHCCKRPVCPPVSRTVYIYTAPPVYQPIYPPYYPNYPYPSAPVPPRLNTDTPVYGPTVQPGTIISVPNNPIPQ